VVGISQWLLKLPAELVWVHVTLAVATWLTVLWAVGAAGLLESEPSPSAAAQGSVA
jgi:cytochrome c oxidase assembly protein subunit 15